METKKNLDDLPRSNDEFWEHAEVHTDLVEHDILSEDGHYFERMSGRQAQCKNCFWGFELDPGDEIREGHLYNKKGKLVI